MSKAFTSNVTAGSLIIVGVMYEDITTAIATLTDNLGNTYTQIGAITRTLTALGLQLFYAYNVTGGACTVSATSTAANPVTIAIHEYSGAMTAGTPFDATAVGTADATQSPDSGNLTTAVASELLFAFAANNRSSLTAGAGYTRREDFALSDFGDSEDQIAGAGGTYNATTGNLSVNGQWILRLAAFKPPAAGGAAASSRMLMGVG